MNTMKQIQIYTGHMEWDDYIDENYYKHSVMKQRISRRLIL